MSDRIILEQSEARELLGDYQNTAAKFDTATANQWLLKQWPKVLKKFGAGADVRVKGYMREIKEGISG